MPVEAQASNNGSVTATEKRPPVTNVVKLDPENPIPINYSQIFTITSGQRYIPFLGNDDNIANILWEARLLSLTHNSCIQSIAKTSVGKGIFVNNVEEGKVDKEFLTFIDKVNKCDSLSGLILKGIDAMLTDGNAWLEIVKGSFAGKNYIKVYLHTTLDCRFADPPKDKDEPIEIIKSRRFRERRNKMISSRSLKAVVLPLYSDSEIDQPNVWKKDESGDLHTVIHLFNYFGGIPFYGIAPSVPGLRQQVMEGSSAQYNLDNFDNNMVMSALLVFKSAMTQQEAIANAKEIIKTHTGKGKIGRVGVVASEGGIEDFELIPLETQKEGSFIEFDKRNEEKIITAHNWDKIFFANSADGSFGKGSTYIRGIWDVKKATVIDPLLEYWTSTFIKPFIKIVADHLKKPEWLKYEFGFKSAMPFSYASDININKVLTKNEGREMIGKTKIEGDQWEETIDGNIKKQENVQGEPTA